MDKTHIWTRHLGLIDPDMVVRISIHRGYRRPKLMKPRFGIFGKLVRVGCWHSAYVKVHLKSGLTEVIYCHSNEMAGRIGCEILDDLNDQTKVRYSNG